MATFTVEVNCVCPKCGHEWDEEKDVEIEKPM